MEQVIENVETLKQTFKQAVTRFDSGKGIAWYFMNPKPRACISLALFEDYRKCRNLWENINRSAIEEDKEPPIRYAVIASMVPGVYNYGGDLELIIDSVTNEDRERLRDYARMCIEDVYLFSVNLNQPMTTISLVQGDALGGGFELALSCNLVVAEKGAQFGFPEILFNLFPGMGAYSLLSRKLGSTQAEKIITSATLYSASEMHEMGVVDLLAEEGEGERAVYEYVAHHSRKRNAFQSIQQVRQRVNPISLEELMDVAEIWVDNAMKIGSRELRVMKRLLRSQERVHNNSADTETPGKIQA